jgi:hypothetical protein
VLSTSGETTDHSDEIAGFVNPARVFSRDDVLARPSQVPAQDGVYVPLNLMGNTRNPFHSVLTQVGPLA